MQKKALLALADGSLFWGEALGVLGTTVGEVVFNTSMTGYQEVLTDPSYASQLVTLTYPHIGNVGINAADEESSKVWVSGLIVRNVPARYQNWRAEESLEKYLIRQRVVGISEIDTRRLTKLLRETGAQNGCISSESDINPEKIIQQAQAFKGLNGLDLAKEVSVADTYSLQPSNPHTKEKLHVVVYDFGVKRNILNCLLMRGCELTVVPAKTSARKVLSLAPDGVLLSNGPGDPAPCTYAIEATRVFLQENLPIFGICLGIQLLALASGANTKKMKFGHHGSNHPVQDMRTGRVMITSQNHGFAVDESTLPAMVEVTHRSLFDGTVQGIALKGKPAFGFQGHPEASPGPHDADTLFDQFITLMQEAAHAKKNGS